MHFLALFPCHVAWEQGYCTVMLINGKIVYYKTW